MFIKNFFVRKKMDSAETMEANFTVEFLKSGLEHYTTFEKLKDLVADRLVTELYPSIKDKLLGDEEFRKIINEIRLKVAKHFVEEK